MKIFGFQVPFTKATDTNLVTPISQSITIGTPVGVVGEVFPGSWQQNLTINDTKTALSFSAVFACVSLISGDIAKLPVRLMRKRADGRTMEEFESPAYSPVLRKPNRYQTAQQFLEQWVLSKLIWGNTYVYKERDNRGVVIAQYILDAQRIRALVAPDGEVFYQVHEDRLSGIESDALVFPGSEIIHDRGKTLFHPLVGVSPIFACALSSTQGKEIQVNSSVFFKNMSRPSGHLTAPGRISDETAARLKKQFESEYAGNNIGRVLVSGEGMKYEPMGAIAAEQAQLVEQLGWTTEDVARAFLIPLYKISAGDQKVDPAMKQEYYDRCLHPYINAIETLQSEGLRVPPNVAVDLDTRELLRLDPGARYAKLEKGVKAAILSPNEARAEENYPPVKGGEIPFLQQQNWPLDSLQLLQQRELENQMQPVQPVPPETDEPEPEEEEDDDLDEVQAAYLLSQVRKELTCAA